MSLPPASQCCRVVHRRLRPQHNHFWVPDSLLSAAFERFCAVSRTSARYGSSVPGPMESRKRMGKRQMGELNFGHSHPAAAPWELESLVDLTQWKWLPPSSPSTRSQHHRTKETSRQSLSDIIRNWAGVPAIDSTTQKHEQAPPNRSRMASALDIHFDGPAAFYATDASTIEERPSIAWDARHTPQGVADTALSALLQDLSSKAASDTLFNFTTFCDSWKQHLTDRCFSDEIICSVLKAIKQALSLAQQQINGPLSLGFANKAKLVLFDSTIQGLSCRRSPESTHFDHHTVNYLLHEISELPRNMIRLFKDAMALIPDCHIKDMSAGILSNLCAYFTTIGRGGKPASLARQANRMAEPSKKLTLVENRNILNAASQQLVMHNLSKDLDYPRMRQGWLLLLARLPDIGEDYLVRICLLLETGREVEPLSNRDVCQLYLALAKRRSPIKCVTTVENSLQLTQGLEDSQYYSTLSSALWKTGQRDLIKGLCKFLGHLGREQDIVQLVKGLRNILTNEASPLVTLAVGMKEPLLALDILYLYMESRRAGLDFWNSDFGSDALSMLTKSPSLRHLKLLSALGLHAKNLERRQLWAGPRRAGRNIQIRKRQIWKTARAARAFSRSPSVSRRTALTLISQCIRYLVSHDAVITVEVLRALFYNITRDLAEGRPGITSRLRWFLQLLLKRAGPDEVSRTGLALKRWRESNYKVPPIW
ncbi:hypothetical protein F5B20DRAFT_530141 [Whalleya microplaca]|nr:hypothetical protein F5B20DRAFT_530141 [Whalleya microplaca]